MATHPLPSSTTFGANVDTQQQSSSSTSTSPSSLNVNNSIISETNGLSYTNLDLTNNATTSPSSSSTIQSTTSTTNQYIPPVPNHSSYHSSRSNHSQQYQQQSTTTSTVPGSKNSPSSSPTSSSHMSNLYPSSSTPTQQSSSYKDYGNGTGAIGGSGTPTPIANDSLLQQTSTNSPVNNHNNGGNTSPSITGIAAGHSNSNQPNSNDSIVGMIGYSPSASYFDTLGRSTSLRNGPLMSNATHLQNGSLNTYGLMDPIVSGNTSSSPWTIDMATTPTAVPQYKWMQVKRNIPKPGKQFF
ncbi:hypothetical protein BLA29_001924 [Euroglyphus maynei]|uniref:Uncharacterized protein n=1 Tax=Euroglyphus maynei TaxID=6958 RepID=A0A1Y3B0D1_EURMA|nr:hypothetical protein BLA29_001924 [Euroglyphus maynei]